MSTPVVTSSWAGNFDCSVCHRKRLMAEEFSKKVCVYVCLYLLAPGTIHDAAAWKGDSSLPALVDSSSSSSSHLSNSLN